MLVLTLLNIYVSYAATNVFDFGVSQSVLNVYKDQLVNDVKNSIMKAQIDSITAAEFAGAFRVEYNFTQPEIGNITFDEALTQITLQAPNLIVSNIVGLKVPVKFFWGYKTAIYDAIGEGTLSIVNSTLVSQVAMIQLPNGSMALVTQNVKFNIIDFTLDINGFKDIQDLKTLLNFFKGTLKSRMESQLEDYYKTSVITSANQFIQKVPLIKKFNENLAFAYNLTSNPQATVDSLQFNAIGVFINPENPNYSPNVGGFSSVPNFKSTSTAVQVYVSEYTLNTLTYVLNDKGYFSAVFNSDNTGLNITTSTLNYIMPGIETTFTPNQPCSIVCNAQTNPTNDIIPPSFEYPYGLIFTEFPGVCTVWVTSVNQIALVLDIGVQANSSLQIDDWVLSGNLTILEVTSISIQEDNIVGDRINLQGLADFLNLIANLTVPYLNEHVFNNGLPLPTIPGINLADSELNMYDGYFSILSNPIFTN